ncbi:MAG TPA: inorganic phosphate transporter [Euzebyales bacterium]|nr:inorganic phosphate transporter [Euzebyales bacterium]
MFLWLAAAFAVINGANDGGAMVASQLRVPGVRPLGTIVVVAGALVAVPLVLGTGVADTLTSGLVRASQEAQPQVVATGAVAAIVVVAVLTRLGLPTSLTLGMVGGIVGAGLGRGLPILGTGVGRVVAIGVAAPIVGGLLAQRLVPLSALALTRRGTRGLALLAATATVAQAVAYAANDGQKMFAVVAVSAAGITPSVAAGVAVLFSVGAIVGLRAAAGTLGGGIVRGGPQEEVTAQLGAAVAVLSSAALGAPVSMTQAVAGGLVGTGMLRGLRQVRWRVAGQLALAWVLTLPSAAVVGAVVVQTWRL